MNEPPTGTAEQRRIAVAVLHGIGGQPADFAAGMIDRLRAAFARAVPEATPGALVCEPVHWAPVLEAPQLRLRERVSSVHDLDWENLRRFMISVLGDGIAYEPTAHNRAAYDAIHQVVAESFHALAARAGPDAPLCVIAHSLGSVIASNYLYDLSKPELVSDSIREHMFDAPLERGETFTHFFTLGSPLAIWALHHEDFGCPLEVPSADLANHHSSLAGEWLNFFDRDDVIAYPLRQLNTAYGAAVTEDVEVAAGGRLTGATPMSHTGYEEDGEVLRRIVECLARTWRGMGEPE